LPVRNTRYLFIVVIISAVVLQAGMACATKFQDTLKLAQQGDYNAQSYIGHSYLCGLEVPKNDEQARYWYLKVINHPKADAKIVAHASLILGTMYSTGKGGKLSYQKAIKYLEAAARQGFSDAHIFLGHMYVRGQGVARDYRKALDWWQKADKLGHPAAGKYIAELLSSMHQKHSGTDLVLPKQPQLGNYLVEASSRTLQEITPHTGQTALLLTY